MDWWRSIVSGLLSGMVVVVGFYVFVHVPATTELKTQVIEEMKKATRRHTSS